LLSALLFENHHFLLFLLVEDPDWVKVNGRDGDDDDIDDDS
jgi:hypothetical protein